MFIRVDPNNTNPPYYDVIEINASLAVLRGNTVYNDCSAGPGLIRYDQANYKETQSVTCHNLPNPLNTDIYEV